MLVSVKKLSCLNTSHVSPKDNSVAKMEIDETIIWLFNDTSVYRLDMERKSVAL